MIRKLVLLGLATFVGKKLLARSASPSANVGHAPTDLAGDAPRDGSTRADPHFRPDPHGHVPEEDLEGLRPVTFKPAAYPT
ncbi:hypothetical protein [Novosphingobium soli]|uniref:Uncharacterized protein n=1 Tax=Novosphingobium soli TaxID=574956 RepID=A0ABV6CVC8_9SPHN